MPTNNKTVTTKPPTYRRQPGTGRRPDRAFVVVDGKRVYLGPYGSPESHQAYARLLVGGSITTQTNQPSDLLIAELAEQFQHHARSHYGEKANEYVQHRINLDLLVDLYGSTPARDFRPADLKVVRSAMIKRGWCRSTVNKAVIRMRTIFKWAVSESLIPAPTWQALTSVPGLQRGRTQARETEPVRPVPEAHIQAVRPYVSRQVAAMIDLQLLTGARPGELVIMRTIDLDTSGDVWAYEPPNHKNAHRGHHRTILLGPRARKIVTVFLTDRPVNAYLFSPTEAEHERRVEQRSNRQTPVWPSHQARYERQRTPHPARAAGQRYTTTSYRRAIQRGIEKANDSIRKANQRDKGDREAIPTWSPNQLRHNAGTWLRKESGIEVTRAVLGHRSAAITEVYAEFDRAKAADIIARVG